MSKKTDTTSRRVLGGVVRLAALALFWPLLLVSAVAVRLGIGAPIMDRENRLHFRTESNDARVTRLGRYLRKSGLDRLPALLLAVR